MRYVALILILILTAGTANAETFKCQAGPFGSSGDKVVVTATINEDGETGTIKVAGVTHQAKYHVEGFDRRWDFELQEDGTFDYALVLKVSGVATYYDFSSAEAGEPISGSQLFVCK